MTKYIAPNGFPSEVLCTHSLTGNCAYEKCSKYHPVNKEEMLVAGIEFRYKGITSICVETDGQGCQNEECEYLHLNRELDTDLNIDDIITPNDIRDMMRAYNDKLYKYITNKNPKSKAQMRDTIYKFGQNIKQSINMFKHKGKHAHTSSSVPESTAVASFASESSSPTEHLTNLLDRAMSYQ
jgi:hypothetical protein